MNMDANKEQFIKSEFIRLFSTLKGDERGRWGKMNAQQMTEHVAGFFKVSTGKIHFALTTPPEYLPRYKEFLMSEMEFRQNTKAPVLPEEPLPLQFSDMHQAIEELSGSTSDFFQLFKENPLKTTLHPVFGELNYEEWIQLHHKHVVHHLKQFNLV